MNRPEIQQFIQENHQLFWWIKPEEKKDIEPEFLVETILNYGNGQSVKKLFELLEYSRLLKSFNNRYHDSV